MPREDWIQLGLIAAGLLVAVVIMFLFVGLSLERARDTCPSCAQRHLKNINRFRANPPPNFRFYRCEQCDAEFVQYDGQKEFVARTESGLSQHPGWDV